MAVATQNPVEVTINYYKPPVDSVVKPAYVIGSVESRMREYVSKDVHVDDIRGIENKFTLDRNGFQLVHHVAKEKTFDDEERCRKEYYPEIEKLLREMTGATHAFAHSSVVRNVSRSAEIEILKGAQPGEILKIDGPAMFVHVDQSYDGAETVFDNLVKHHPGAAHLAPLRNKHTRFAIINAWRPLKPVMREPLAVCDASSVSEDDLREVTLRMRKDKPPQSLYSDQALWEVVANPQHKWYWPRHQTPEEVLFIKCFDSKMDVARRTPHTAIQTAEDSGPPRESIEVRCLCVWE